MTTRPNNVAFPHIAPGKERNQGHMPGDYCDAVGDWWRGGASQKRLLVRVAPVIEISRMLFSQELMLLCCMPGILSVTRIWWRGWNWHGNGKCTIGECSMVHLSIGKIVARMTYHGER